MATKLAKPGKKANRDKVNIDRIIGILPLLSARFNTDPPNLSTEDLLSCEPDRVFELYNFFLKCMSLTSAEELTPTTIKPTNLKTDIFNNKDLFYSCHKMRFFFAVREMMTLASAPTFCFKDLAAPDISTTIMFAKTLINFLRFTDECFNTDECFKNLRDKQEEESLRWEVGLLKKEVSESEESYEMNLAKADMEENAKLRMQEDISATNSELDTIANTVPVETIRMQESEKMVLHSKERISEAKLYLLEKQRNSERLAKLIVTSDKLLEQRNASKRTLENLCEEQQLLEVQISQCKKLEAYGRILKEFEVLLVSCREFEPLLRDTDVAKQNSANLIREKEELQTSLQTLFQEKALLIKRIDNLRERRERMTSSANQQLHGDNVSKFPNEVDMLKDEFEKNLENIDDVKLDIASLNEVMGDYRNRFSEQKDKLVAYITRFTGYYRTHREELDSKVPKLEDYLTQDLMHK